MFSIKKVFRPIEQRPTMKSKPIVLISTQRSGTNFFRSLLRATGKITDYDEILKLENDDIKPGSEYFDWEQHSYFNFRASEIANDNSLSIPSEDHISYLFFNYFSYLSQIEPNKPYFVTDIKYNSLHHFNQGWQWLRSCRNIFNLLSQSGFHVIHLVRKNMFDLYLSHVSARKSKIYVAKTNQVLEPQTIQIDTKAMLYQLERLELERKYVRECLSHLPRTIEFEYESLVDAKGTLSKSVAAELNEFLEDELKFQGESEYQKIIRDKWSVIENAEEVRQALQNSPYERFIGPLEKTNPD